MQKHRHAVVCGSADLLYNLIVLWASVEVEPKHVWNERWNRRERLATPRGFLKPRRKPPRS
jgi:phosphoribosyl-ATP pyrophosphohydrolase